MDGNIHALIPLSSRLECPVFKAWAERGAERPLEGLVLRYIGGRTYEVAISGRDVRVVQEQALSVRRKEGERR